MSTEGQDRAENSRDRVGEIIKILRESGVLLNEIVGAAEKSKALKEPAPVVEDHISVLNDLLRDAHWSVAYNLEQVKKIHGLL